MSVFIGSGVAMATPFNEDKSVNFDAYERLINFQIENGTDAIICCGTTGEASTLEDDEHLEVIERAVQITKGRVPVIAGTGSNYTEHGAMMSREAQKLGADACLINTPYYNKTTQKGMIEHYRYIASQIDIPIILYNVPSRTGLNILPGTLLELSKIDNIVAIKEASGNIVQIAEMAELCGDKIDIYAGNDDYVVPVLSLGGKGVISTIGNVVPKEMHDMVAKYLDGDGKGALKLQLDLLGLIRAMFCEVNPIPVKEALNQMGFNAGGYRLPLTEMEDNNKKFLISEMKKLNLI